MVGNRGYVFKIFFFKVIGVLKALNFSLQIIEIILSVVITVLVLLQGKGGGLGGIFGSDSGGAFRTKRGAEKIIFQSTIGLSALFFLNVFFIIATAPR